MTGSRMIKILSEMVDEIIISENEPLLDEMYPDVLGDPDKRVEAVDLLISFIEKYREDL